jgi:hypothetical protein
MLFPTLAFGVFFLFVYFTAWSLDRENGRRKLFLLLASWFFYAQWDWRFVGLLIASAVLNWGVAALIARPDAGGAAAAGLAGRAGRRGQSADPRLLQILRLLRRTGGRVLARFGWERDLPLLQIVLPVGISFFTFQGISYVVDVHRGKTPAAKSAAGRHAADELLPASGGRADRAGVGPAAPVRPDAAPDAGDGDARPAADRLGPVQEDGDRVRAVDEPGRSGVLRPVGPFGTSTSRRRSMAMRSRSIATSRPIRTWRSGSRPCWAIPSRAISTSRIGPVRCRASGGAGTSACPAGCGTTSMCRWGAGGRG